MGLLHGHGTLLQSYRDTPIHGKTVQLQIHRRRYRCQSCSKTMFDPIADLDNKRQATKRLVDYLRKHCFQETFAALARQVDLDEKTIRNIFEDYTEELEAQFRFVTPRYLGIDELMLIGDYRAVITNIERRTVFDMRATRLKADLLPYFKSLRDKDSVEWVAMDMYGVYRQVVKATLPQARIVVDRFHIQRMGNEALEKLRKRLRKTLPERQRLKLKDERHLLLKRQHDLSPEAAERMLAWFTQFPQLSEVHALKEGFLSIWDHKERSSAEQAYQVWLTRIPAELVATFKDLTTAMTNWRDEIFNYFDHPVTNAYTESVNNLTRVMNRMGRGYSFEVIRARMLYNGAARKNGAVMVQEPAKDDPQPPVIFYQKMGSSSPPRQRMVTRLVEYGPSIDTLARLLEDGYFE